MNKFDGFEPEFSDEVTNNDADIRDIAVPFGVIDTRKLNSGYKQLLEDLKIQNFDNMHTITMILEQIKKYRNNEELKFELNSELFYDIDSIDKNWFPSTESNLEAILFMAYNTLASIFNILQSKNLVYSGKRIYFWL